MKELLRRPNWLTFQAASLISRFGDSVDSIAFSWLVYQMTGSTLLMGAVLAFNAIPNLLFAPFAGVAADHYKKQTLVVFSALGRGGLVALTGVLFLAGQLQVWHLFVLTFLNSTLETFGSPALSALNVHLIEKELMAEAAGVSQTASMLVQMLGLGLSGVIIAVWGISGALLLDGVTFLLAAGFSALPKLVGDQARETKLTVKVWWVDFREGLQYTLGNRTFFVLLLTALMINLAFTPVNVLEVPYVKDVLSGGPDMLSWLGIALSLGMVAGGLMVGVCVKKWGTWTTFYGGAVMMGLASAFLVWGTLPVTLIVYFVVGMTLALVNGPIGAWMSAHVPADRQGRVFATVNALALVATPLGAAISGWAAGMMPITTLFLGMGVAAVGISLLSRLALGRVAEDGSRL